MKSMCIEQRIDRIDQLGKRFPYIALVNLMYEGTVDTGVHRAL
jgi:hypothetical protein